jgi:hypothetical protein
MYLIINGDEKLPRGRDQEQQGIFVRQWQIAISQPLLDVLNYRLSFVDCKYLVVPCLWPWELPQLVAFVDTTTGEENVVFHQEICNDLGFGPAVCEKEATPH